LFGRKYANTIVCARRLWMEQKSSLAEVRPISEGGHLSFRQPIRAYNDS